jgi:glutaredoxin
MQQTNDKSVTQVIIYSTPTCAFCKTEKQYLEHLGVSYVVKDVEEDKAALDELVEKSGGASVPVTDIAGVVIRGFNRPLIDSTLRDKGLLAAA